MLTIIALLRFIPYAISLIVTLKKGYKWLPLAIFSIIVLAVVNTVNPLPQDIRSSLGSIPALCLLFHVLELKRKEK